jgi:hypothetical protein
VVPRRSRNKRRDLTEEGTTSRCMLAPVTRAVKGTSLDATVRHKKGPLTMKPLQLLRSMAVVLFCPYWNKGRVVLGHQGVETSLQCQGAQAMRMRPQSAGKLYITCSLFHVLDRAQEISSYGIPRFLSVHRENEDPPADVAANESTNTG